MCRIQTESHALQQQSRRAFFEICAEMNVLRVEGDASVFLRLVAMKNLELKIGVDAMPAKRPERNRPELTGD